VSTYGWTNNTETGIDKVAIVRTTNRMRELFAKKLEPTELRVTQNKSTILEYINVHRYPCGISLAKTPDSFPKLDTSGSQKPTAFIPL
jgi:hypothetical protein